MYTISQNKLGEPASALELSRWLWEDGVLGIGLVEQALRWHDWAGPDDEKEQQLVRALTDTFIRMLKYNLAQLRHPGIGQNALDDYLTNVRVFLSHSKHGGRGEVVAGALRKWLNDNTNSAPFLDIHNIPAGIPFDLVLDYEASRSVMVAIYTDSYSSREWCRREVIIAKRRRVPMLVVDCLQDTDPSSLPYLGNVPWVRMNPETMDRLDYVVGHLLDEVYKDFLWQCRVESFCNAFPQTTFFARAAGANFPGLHITSIFRNRARYRISWASNKRTGKAVVR